MGRPDCVIRTPPIGGHQCPGPVVVAAEATGIRSTTVTVTVCGQLRSRRGLHVGKVLDRRSAAPTSSRTID